MGNAGQLVRSFRRRVPAHRRDEQPELPLRVAWTIAAVTVVSRSVLSTIVALLLWSVLPSLVGFQTTTVMSGSMAPQLMVGDAIVVRHLDASQLALGQVLLFDDPDHPGRLRMHRLVGIEDHEQLETKGDANEGNDSTTVGMNAVHGAAFLRIPFAGLPNYWFRTGQAVPLVVSGILTLALLYGVRLGRLLETESDKARRRHRGVKLPGLHRATAAGAVLVILGGAGLASTPSAAQAGYQANSPSGTNTWGTTCADRTPTNLGSNPVLYWGYGTINGSDVSDLSGQGDVGTSPSGSDAAPISCVDGFTPAAQVGGTGSTKGVVVEKSSHAFPGAMTVATWFKTGVAGGTLADFGSSGTVTPASSSSGIDRVLYMRSDGNLVFGAITSSVAGVLGSPIFCTTAQASGYADSTWHLAVATYSYSTGCTLTVDATTVSTPAPQVSLQILNGYSGYWRFGYDAVTTSGGWTGATTRQAFQGALDESQVYASIVSAAPILARGH